MAAVAATALGAAAFVQTGPSGTSTSSTSLRGRTSQPQPQPSANFDGAASMLAFGVGTTVAASFRKAQKCVKASAVAVSAFENELGVQAPLGFWDPLGLAKDGDAESFSRRRTTELKNGRVAMFACLGYIVPEYFRWPGLCAPSENLAFADVPNGLAAFGKVPGEGWVQIIIFAGAVEKGLYPSETMTAPGAYPNAGVLGIPNGSSLPDGETRNRKLNAELANGRLAMMAITGMWFQDGLTGSAWGDWANYTDSPLRAFEGELGVQAPFGYWDPLGLSSDGDMDTFKRRRETEIKHGRVSMWAAMGYIAPEYFRWPGILSPSEGLKFTDVPNGLAACGKVPGNGWAQVILFCGCVENYWGYDKYTKGGNPGEYGWKAITSTDPETRKRKLNAELANGRLAMMAVTGMFFQDGLTGSAWGDWGLYVDSPLRGAEVLTAFENELGVQEPVGFWDPAGFTSDGDVSNFKRRRSVELKHGRISMLATMGYITPEVVGKLPGYLSPSAGLKFADIPNGLAAISKVPSLGWAQIAAYFGFVEFSGGFQDYKTGTPGDYGFKVLTSSDPAEKTKKLSAEIANGRLAMMAIIGMFFQDGLTGSAWGDWALYTASPLRAFENELGVQAPLGFWDPVGYTQNGDAALFRRRRETEIKHGRVAMFATLGYIVPEYVRFPGYLCPQEGLAFKDVPAGLAALKAVPAVGWAQIFLFIGLVDFCYYRGDPAREPGDFVNAGILGVPNGSGPIKDPEERKTKLNSEIANGRLAMMAIIGMFFQDGLTGSAWGDWALFEASPLRAFDPSNEVGCVQPLGFWDPAGITAGKDEAFFKNMRGYELKHGRVAMMCIVGFLAQHFWRFPGCFDIPDGIAALKTMPASANFGCLFLVAGFFELRILGERETEPGNFQDPLKIVGNAQFGGYDETWRNFELQNGRLAMFGAIGTIVANAYTGLDAFEQWAEARPVFLAYLKTTLPYSP